MLARTGERKLSGTDGVAEWRFSTTMPGGQNFEIRCSGPDLPVTVPDNTVVPSDIPKNPKWRETYRLTVAPPLITLDICWRQNSPLRILAFSRGDWEKFLGDLG